MDIGVVEVKPEEHIFISLQLQYNINYIVLKKLVQRFYYQWIQQHDKTQSLIWLFKVKKKLKIHYNQNMLSLNRW